MRDDAQAVDSQTDSQLHFFELLGHSKYGFTAINIFDEGAGIQEKFYTSAPEECVRIARMFNGRGQVYASLNPVRQDIDKKVWHVDDDVAAVLNIFIDTDAIKRDPDIPEKELKKYAATEQEYIESWKAIPIILRWMGEHGFKPGYQDKTGNGIRFILPIPAIYLNDNNREEVSLKIKAFLDLIRKDTGLKIDAVHDLRRITGVPGTLNKKKETHDRRNRMREPMLPMPARDEDSKLRDFILQLECKKEDASGMKDEAVQDAGTFREKLNHWLECDAKLRLLYGGEISDYQSRSEAELALYQKLLFYGFDDSAIDRILSEAKIGKWATENESYREHTRKKAHHYQTERKSESQKESWVNDGMPAAKKAPLPRLQDIELHLLPESYILKYLNYALRSSDAYFEYHFAAALSHLSTAVDRRLHIRMVQQTIYPNIWSFCLGDSTVSRKTTAAKKGEEMAAAVFGLDKFLPRAGSPEALIEILSDTPRGVIWKDEAGQTLKEMQKTYMGDIKDTFCKLYENQGDHRKLRTSQRKNLKTEFKIVDPYVTIFLATVPDVFKEYTNILDVTSGWLVRFLYFTPDYEKQYMPFRPETDEDIAAWAGALTSLKNIYNKIQSTGGEIKLSQEALVIFQQWQETSERKLMESKNKIEMAIFGRLVTYCLKIALILTISENPEAKEISARLIKDSISLVDGYFKHVTVELIEEIGLDEQNNLQDKIIGVIKRAGGKITQRQLLKRLHRTLRDVEEAVDALIASGEIVIVQSDSRTDSRIIKLNVKDTVPTVPTIPTVPEEKGINGTVVDTTGNSKDIHALNVKDTVPTVPTIPTVPEENGINGTVVDTTGNSEDIHARHACKEQLSSYGTLVHNGTVGTQVANGGQEKITNDSPDEAQKFGEPQHAGLPDESARVVMPTYTLQDIEQACKEWERSHQQSINSNNLTKVTFDLKPQFHDIAADDLAHLIRKYARISKPTGNNGNHLEKCGIIKEYEMIKLRFLVDNIPVFVGMDGRGYGPFQKGMEAQIPAVNAMALLKREAAVKIEDRTEGVKR